VRMLLIWEHVYCHKLSGFVASGHDSLGCSFHRRIGIFAVQDTVAFPLRLIMQPANCPCTQARSSSCFSLTPRKEQTESHRKMVAIVGIQFARKRDIASGLGFYGKTLDKGSDLLRSGVSVILGRLLRRLRDDHFQWTL
jgi:hypothetical protein